MTTGGRPQVPLHAPEAVQTFGYLLAFRRTDGGLERCSANIAGLLGQGPADLAGRLPADILSPEQALAVFECLQVMRETLWQLYGHQVQQAWRDQLRAGPMPDFDPDEPF